MIDGLMPYPDYQETGVAAVGLAPRHWEMVRLGTIGTFLKGSGGSKEDEVPEGVPCVRYGDLYTQCEFFIRRSRSFVTTERAAAYTPVLRGDILFAGSGETFEDIGKSAVVLIDPPVVAGGDVLILRPSRQMLPEFLGYMAGSWQSVNQKARMGRGVTVKHVYSSDLKYLWFAAPPLNEQAAIVRFIDHADRQIGRYISAKQKLITLLEEEQRAIVRQVVAHDPGRGIPHDGSSTRKLGSLATIFNGTTPSRNQPAYWTSGSVPWLASGKVNDGLIETPTAWVSERAVRECSLRLVPRGAVVLGMVGQGRTRGLSALMGMAAYINQNLAGIVPGAGLDGRFLQIWLSANYEMVRGLGRGGNQEALNCEIVANLRLPVPSLDEQVAIVASVGGATSKTNLAIKRASGEISLLRELRMRLIADVVTGKLDVRDAAANLQAETSADEEPIEDDDSLGGAEEAQASDDEWAE